ncbi:3-hydroxybutyrate dehydrogenase [Nocardioides phosphati]|uniref:3-hydroxybutyrate dehydrogenase n=1 Tax=Nocardioides phosphati TaxID=1867775 RepID=A0ABQ2NB35_9ACTN|nr:mycofactocin-coupled SDR family oxidoreductase [Nocardioides phosphati]GGO85505.1 3-hydroxybutyrate dehydrogenase [Nocardioides phosphati]
MTTGRVALVTGGARGIGAAVVRALADDGCHVVAVDLEPPVPLPGEAGVERHALDVRDGAALRALVADVVRRHGRVDVAVAAAGVVAGGRPLWESPEDQLTELLDVNLRGVWNLATAAVPAMMALPEPREGRFVALASAAAHRGLWHLAAYGASKHAVVGLVKGLAADLRGTGITATAVSPGSTRTPMLEATARLYDVDAESLAERHLVDRLLEPDEIAQVVRWLCSPAASALTGTVLHADGGFTT